ncbi:MAG: hypothetical protein MI784_08440 [Cytophagales bacterium]|nr:hypothetical protein [Cytophagales bacterium]
MGKYFFYIGIAVWMVVSVSCRRELACPAYASTFYYDHQQRTEMFNPFYPDGMPKPAKVNKHRRKGIAKNGLWQKTRRKLFPKKEYVPRYPKSLPLADSLYTVQAIGDSQRTNVEIVREELIDAELDTASVLADTLMAPKKHKYNVEQLVYLQHFIQYLPQPDTLQESGASAEQVSVLDSAEVKKDKKPWWRLGIFKKKKQKEDSLKKS